MYGLQAYYTTRAQEKLTDSQPEMGQADHYSSHLHHGNDPSFAIPPPLCNATAAVAAINHPSPPAGDATNSKDSQLQLRGTRLITIASTSTTATTLLLLYHHRFAMQQLPRPRHHPSSPTGDATTDRKIKDFYISGCL